MKTIKLIILLAFFASTGMFAHDLALNSWNDYWGDIEGKEVKMSLYRFNNQQVRGHYYFIGTDEKIYLAGRIDNGTIKLYAIKNKKVIAVFNAKLTSNNTNKLEGRVSFDNKAAKKLKLNFISTITSNYKTRYYLQSVTTYETETFAKQLKNAILEKNKQWLSENISYPIMVSINGKSRTTIRNKKELLQNFDAIFHAAFIEKAEAFECIDIFCNYKGLMLGAGEIWMNCVSTVNNDKCQLKITAINN